MMDFVCGGGIDFPDVGDGACCYGATMDRCTCWEPIHEPADQCEPDTDPPRVVRPSPCADCAYRPDSPERTGDDRYRGSTPGDLDRLARGDVPFHCHDGMRRVVAYEHPSGAVHVVDTDHYDPPMVDGVPYRADGSPAFVCAGWRARHDAIVGGS